MGGVALMLAWLSGSTGQALTLAELPAPATAIEASASDAQGHDALDETLARLVPKAKIAGARYFRLGQKLGYQPVVKRIDNLALEHKATRIAMPDRRPGYDLIEAWRVKGGGGLAVVMDPGASDHPLVGYYALTLAD
jgi:hypothetical protein